MSKSQVRLTKMWISDMDSPLNVMQKYKGTMKPFEIRKSPISVKYTSLSHVNKNLGVCFQGTDCEVPQKIMLPEVQES